MLTLSTIPKGFTSGHINTIQRNALKSWLALGPECEVIVFGDDPGVAETCKELGAKHVPNVPRNEFGTPLLNWTFEEARKIGRGDILMYTNADIIFTGDLLPTIKKIKEEMFLAVGRRMDMDIKEEMDFKDPEWEKKLRVWTKKDGRLHGYAGIDYFIFPKDLPHGLPAFPVGRPGWDNWFIDHIRRERIPVIDTTPVNLVVHQNHPSVYRKPEKKNENKKSIALAGGFLHMMTIRDADWLLTEDGLKRPEIKRRTLALLSLFYPWQALLAAKRYLERNFLGK